MLLDWVCVWTALKKKKKKATPPNPPWKSFGSLYWIQMLMASSHSSYFPEETETRLWCSLHLSPFDYSFIFLILTTHTESRHVVSSSGMMYDPQTAVSSGREEYREVCIKGLQRPLSVFGRRLSRSCNLCLATSLFLFLFFCPRV